MLYVAKESMRERGSACFVASTLAMASYARMHQRGIMAHACQPPRHAAHRERQQLHLHTALCEAAPQRTLHAVRCLPEHVPWGVWVMGGQGGKE